jgi:hypothetical protein
VEYNDHTVVADAMRGEMQAAGAWVNCKQLMVSAGAGHEALGEESTRFFDSFRLKK